MTTTTTPDRPMRIYIAGPMSGLPDFNYPAFNQAEQRLLALGYEVENPATNPDPRVFAQAAAQVRRAMDATVALGGTEHHLAALGDWLADNDNLGWKYDLAEDELHATPL